MLANDPVFRLPPDVEMRLSITPLAEVTDPFHELIGVKSLQDKTAGLIGERPLRYAVLDTGVDANHKDLADQILDTADFTRSAWGPDDRNGHGTWCAGAIAARADDFGIRGIAYKAKLLCGKVLGDNGSGNEQSIAAGMKWAYQKGADVFSLSLGGGQMSEGLHKIFTEISQQPGKFIFCAAGNDGGPVNYPAKWSEVIAVGAIDATGKLTEFTSRGPELDILAPGVEILSTMPGSRHGTMTGTSMACPIAAAIGGLVFAAATNAGRGAEFDSAIEMILALRKSGRCDGGDVCKYPVIDPRSLAKFTDPQTPPVPPAPISGVPTRVLVFAGGKQFEFLGAREVK